MPSKHSKNAATRGFFTYQEKKRFENGLRPNQRIGTDSELPFGHCPFTLHPINEAVVTPSGRIYEREAMLEYLLKKTKEIKALKLEVQKKKEIEEEKELRHKELEKSNELHEFGRTQDGTNVVNRKRNATEELTSHSSSRQKVIDTTTTDVNKGELKRVSHWLPQFTPSYNEDTIRKEDIPDRPPSPFSKQPLRVKDLMPVQLHRESTDSNKFICPVSRKTITNQPLVFIKSTGTLLLDSVAKEYAIPSKLCPLTNKTFKMSDIIDIIPCDRKITS